MNDFFALPPFQADAACQQLRRDLRDSRRLTERSPGQFELRGQPVVSLTVNAPVIEAQVVRQPARSPQWETHTLSSSLDVRRFRDELKQRLQRWGDQDD